MALICNREIKRIVIIDDNSDSREEWESYIEDLGLDLKLQIQQNHVPDFDQYLQTITVDDGILSDQHLRKGNYFPVNGAQVVAQCYVRHIAGVLVTRYDESVYKEIRKFRDKIPVLLRLEEFNPDSFLKGLETCINELNGQILTERKPWRTLVRVDDVDEEGNVSFVIPSWDQDKKISILKSDLPSDLRDVLKSDMRLHANVNIGAENAGDLYFTKWEPK